MTTKLRVGGYAYINTEKMYDNNTRFCHYDTGRSIHVHKYQKPVKLVQVCGGQFRVAPISNELAISVGSNTRLYNTLPCRAITKRNGSLVDAKYLIPISFIKKETL